jgi:sRNA-binding regulator protein Hfq
MIKKTSLKRPPKVSRTLLKSPPHLRKTFDNLIKAGVVTVREAGNVLSGDVTLERLLLLKEIRRVLREERHRSCLRTALHANERITVHLLHEGSVTGTIRSFEKYQIAIRPASDEDRSAPPRVIAKHDIKYAHHPALESAVSACRTVDPLVKGMALGIPPKVHDRFHLKSRVLQTYLKNSTPLRFHLFDGDVIQGAIKWWSQYEIGLAVGGGAALTLFRHAILGVSEVNGSRSVMWKRLPLPAPVKAAAPKDAAYDPTADMTPAQAKVWRAIEKLEVPWTVSEITLKYGWSRAAVLGAVLLFEEAEMVREVSREGRRRHFSVVPVGGAK